MKLKLYVGTRKGLFTVERTAMDEWRIEHPPAFLGEPVTMFLQDPRNGDRYAALNLGHFGVKLFRAASGGEEWREIAVPAYPVDTDGEGPSLLQIWELVPGGPAQPDRLWAGTIPGGLFRSDDRGDSWTLVESLWQRPEREFWFGGGYEAAGIHSICVHPGDSDRLSLAISCGGIWESDDGGANWQQTGKGLRAAFLPPEQAYEPVSQDPHRMVRCAAKPERLWVQHHNGIFRSDDGGRTFTEIEDVQPSVFGFAVAVHPHDPDIAWFVPGIKDQYRVPVDGRLVVTRTRDGGSSFEAIYEGLPDAPAYDLVYRHGLDVDASGDVLAFGSTTGGLWVSEDQGDSWRCLSAHLPPINLVRFTG
ncbi:MAG: exo-alpha-sialidase [Oceanospirillaceae bacterium]|nr:exo-alpha-sialidase [Oceanospirillaceae bacterium]